MLYITALSAAVLTALAVMLSLRVVKIRQRDKVAIGDGGNDELIRAIRSQANLLEYSPLALILIGCAEINGFSRIILGLVALVFIAGRVIHPVGIRDAKGGVQLRVLGMQLTLVSMLVLVVINVLWVFWSALT